MCPEKNEIVAILYFYWNNSWNILEKVVMLPQLTVGTLFTVILKSILSVVHGSRERVLEWSFYSYRNCFSRNIWSKKIEDTTNDHIKYIRAQYDLMPVNTIIFWSEEFLREF